MCYGSVDSSCSKCSTHRVTHVTNPVISHEWDKDHIICVKNRTYPWLSVTQILCSRYDGDRKAFEIMT